MKHLVIDHQYQHDAPTRWACSCGYEGYSRMDVESHVNVMRLVNPS